MVLALPTDSFGTFDTGDTAWILTSAALVLLMTPGLAFFYGGLSRGKSVLNMMMMSFGSMATVSVVYVLWGFSMAFSSSITNDAVSAVTRLTDMGVEPFLLSSSLLGVLAQRLVRKLCPSCKRQDGEGRWHAVGCPDCGHSGYKGRTGVYELMVCDDSLRELVHNRAPESELLAAARAGGLRAMREDGERLIAAGITSEEEVLRVTRD